MEYLAHILAMAGIYVILTMSLNLIIGYAGLPAMGHSAFFCLGAYASSLLALNAGLSPWIGILCAAGMAALFGWFVSLTAARLAGDFLALATFGFAVVTHSVVRNSVDLTRGPMGVPGIPAFQFFEWPLDTPWSFLPLVVVVCSFTFLVSLRLVESPFGRILQGIREDETATASLGKNVSHYKRSVFIVGAFFAGMAGNLSFGQRKLLELCRVQALNPELYLLDEPMAGLFPAMVVKMTGMIRRLCEAGKTVVFIEHNMKVVMELSDRVLVLNFGYLIADGTPQAVRNDPAVVEAYLGRKARRAS